MNKLNNTDSTHWLTLPLVKELIVVLVVKLAVIFWIKTTYFSDPVDIRDAEQGIEARFGIAQKTDSQEASSVLMHSNPNEEVDHDG